MAVKSHLQRAAEFLEQYERHDPNVEGYTPEVYHAYAKMLSAQMHDGIHAQALCALNKSQLNEALENMTINKFLSDRSRFCQELDSLLKRM